MNIENLLVASQKIKEVKSDLLQVFEDFQHSKSELRPLFSCWYFDGGKLKFNLFDHDGSIILSQIKAELGLSLLLRIVLERVPGESIVIDSIEIDEDKNFKSQINIVFDDLTIDGFLQYLVKVVYEQI